MRFTATFHANDVFILKDDPASQPYDAGNLRYLGSFEYNTGSRKILGLEQLIVPNNLNLKNCHVDQYWIDKDYEITLISPPGELPRYLREVIKEPDTTLLRIVGMETLGDRGLPVRFVAASLDPTIVFPEGRMTDVHLLFEGKDMQAILKAYHDQPQQLYRIADMKTKG